MHSTASATPAREVDDTFRAASTTRATDDLRAGLARGDPVPWADVVARHHRMLFSLARSYRLSEAEAADVVQQTWLRLLQHAGQVCDPERLAGWLATTARRQALTVRRRTSRERPVPDPTETEGYEFDGTERLYAEHRAEALRAAVAALPARQRRLVELMLEPQPPSYAEISRRLQMPVGSIGPIRGRALRRLRDLLHELDPTPSRAQPATPIDSSAEESPAVDSAAA